MKKVLLCFLALTLCLSGCGRAEGMSAALVSAAENPGPAEDAAEPTAVPGELLETGSGLNEHYYNTVDYFGMPDELTGSSFVLGKAGMAFHGSQPVMGPVVIHYGEDTIIRLAILHRDSYELYAAGTETLAEHMGDPAYVFDVVLDDSEAEELWAREIRVSHMILD